MGITCEKILGVMTFRNLGSHVFEGLKTGSAHNGKTARRLVLIKKLISGGREKSEIFPTGFLRGS